MCKWKIEQDHHYAGQQQGNGTQRGNSWDTGSDTMTVTSVESKRRKAITTHAGGSILSVAAVALWPKVSPGVGEQFCATGQKTLGHTTLADNSYILA